MKKRNTSLFVKAIPPWTNRVNYKFARKGAGPCMNSVAHSQWTLTSLCHYSIGFFLYYVATFPYYRCCHTTTMRKPFIGCIDNSVHDFVGDITLVQGELHPIHQILAEYLCWGCILETSALCISQTAPCTFTVTWQQSKGFFQGLHCNRNVCFLRIDDQLVFFHLHNHIIFSFQIANILGGKFPAIGKF